MCTYVTPVPLLLCRVPPLIATSARIPTSTLTAAQSQTGYLLSTLSLLLSHIHCLCMKLQYYCYVYIVSVLKVIGVSFCFCVHACHLVLRFCTASWSYFYEFKYFKYHFCFCWNPASNYRFKFFVRLASQNITTFYQWINIVLLGTRWMRIHTLSVGCRYLPAGLCTVLSWRVCQLWASVKRSWTPPSLYWPQCCY